LAALIKSGQVQRFVLSVITGAALTVSMRANDFTLPDLNPVASFTIPASWNPSEYENGVEATSDDGTVYIAIEATDIASADDATSSMMQAMKQLAKKGVTVDVVSVKKTKAKVNGLDVVDVSWDGKDSEGACNVSLSIVMVTPQKGLLLTYWASPEGEKKYEKDLREIGQSIKPLPSSDGQISRARDSS
jgi:hypothetical protein